MLFCGLNQGLEVSLSPQNTTVHVCACRHKHHTHISACAAAAALYLHTKVCMWVSVHTAMDTLSGTKSQPDKYLGLSPLISLTPSSPRPAESLSCRGKALVIFPGWSKLLSCPPCALSASDQASFHCIWHLPFIARLISK